MASASPSLAQECPDSVGALSLSPQAQGAHPWSHLSRSGSPLQPLPCALLGQGFTSFQAVCDPRWALQTPAAL